MSAFLEGYEDVNTRIKRFRAEFPSARMIATIEDMDLAAGWILFKACIYREYEDYEPSATGYAFGSVKTLAPHMAKWFVEDAETSAYGRAIAALSPSDSRPTKQDMEKVETSKTTYPSDDLWATLTVKQTEVDTDTSTLGTTLTLVKEALATPPAPAQNPYCRHGQMNFKTGTSAKTGKEYTGYTCPSNERDQQCKPIWL